MIVLSGKDIGSRYTGLVEIISILNEIFPRYKDISKSIFLLFNRYKHEDIEGMNAILKNVWKELPASSKDNSNLKDIFDDFKMKTKDP